MRSRFAKSDKEEKVAESEPKDRAKAVVIKTHQGVDDRVVITKLTDPFKTLSKGTVVAFKLRDWQESEACPEPMRHQIVKLESITAFQFLPKSDMDPINGWRALKAWPIFP